MLQSNVQYSVDLYCRVHASVAGQHVDEITFARDIGTYICAICVHPEAINNHSCT